MVSVLFMAQSVSAVAPESEEDRFYTTAIEVPCPGEDFAAFLEKFSNDASIQREFTEYPLKKQALDLSAAPEVRKIIKYLESNQIQHPVLPLRAEREKKSLNITKIRPRYLNETRRAILTKPGKDDLMVYEFVKNGCWHLSSIDDRSLTGGNPKLHWADHIFPAMDDCTPYHFYFDEKSKRSSNGVLERKGYSPYKVDASFARYKVHEKFMGLDATEIAIPSNSNTHAMYMVAVPVSVQRLAAAVETSTGHRLAIAPPTFESPSGVAYLVEAGEHTSSVVCRVNDQGGF